MSPTADSDSPKVTDYWFTLDAHLLLKSALSARRSGNAEQINP